MTLSAVQVGTQRGAKKREFHFLRHADFTFSCLSVFVCVRTPSFFVMQKSIRVTHSLTTNCLNKGDKRHTEFHKEQKQPNNSCLITGHFE